MTERHITLEVYSKPWDPQDKQANFKEEVAQYSRVDPMPTLEEMALQTGISVGCLARYILVKWAVSGSAGMLELGPRVVCQLQEVVTHAEALGTEEARREAYRRLTHMISWLKVDADASFDPTAK